LRNVALTLVTPTRRCVALAVEVGGE
jgi:hypothetical protein